MAMGFSQNSTLFVISIDKIVFPVDKQKIEICTAIYLIGVPLKHPTSY